MPMTFDDAHLDSEDKYANLKRIAYIFHQVQNASGPAYDELRAQDTKHKVFDASGRYLGTPAARTKLFKMIDSNKGTFGLTVSNKKEVQRLYNFATDLGGGHVADAATINTNHTEYGNLRRAQQQEAVRAVAEKKAAYKTAAKTRRQKTRKMWGRIALAGLSLAAVLSGVGLFGLGAWAVASTALTGFGLTSGLAVGGLFLGVVFGRALFRGATKLLTKTFAKATAARKDRAQARKESKAADEEYIKARQHRIYCDRHVARDEITINNGRYLDIDSFALGPSAPAATATASAPAATASAPAATATATSPAVTSTPGHVIAAGADPSLTASTATAPAAGTPSAGTPAATSGLSDADRAWIAAMIAASGHGTPFPYAVYNPYYAGVPGVAPGVAPGAAPGVVPGAAAVAPGAAPGVVPGAAAVAPGATIPIYTTPYTGAPAAGTGSPAAAATVVATVAGSGTPAATTPAAGAGAPAAAATVATPGATPVASAAVPIISYSMENPYYSELARAFEASDPISLDTTPPVSSGSPAAPRVSGAGMVAGTPAGTSAAGSRTPAGTPVSPIRSAGERSITASPASGEGAPRTPSGRGASSRKTYKAPAADTPDQAFAREMAGIRTRDSKKQDDAVKKYGSVTSVKNISDLIKDSNDAHREQYSQKQFAEDFKLVYGYEPSEKEDEAGLFTNLAEMERDIQSLDSEQIRKNERYSTMMNSNPDIAPKIVTLAFIDLVREKAEQMKEAEKAAAAAEPAPGGEPINENSEDNVVSVMNAAWSRVNGPAAIQDILDHAQEDEKPQRVMNFCMHDYRLMLKQVASERHVEMSDKDAATEAFMQADCTIRFSCLDIDHPVAVPQEGLAEMGMDHATEIIMRAALAQVADPQQMAEIVQNSQGNQEALRENILGYLLLNVKPQAQTLIFNYNRALPAGQRKFDPTAEQIALCVEDLVDEFKDSLQATGDLSQSVETDQQSGEPTGQAPMYSLENFFVYAWKNVGATEQLDRIRKDPRTDEAARQLLDLQNAVASETNRLIEFYNSGLPEGYPPLSVAPADIHNMVNSQLRFRLAGPQYNRSPYIKQAWNTISGNEKLVSIIDGSSTEEEKREQISQLCDVELRNAYESASDEYYEALPAGMEEPDMQPTIDNITQYMERANLYFAGLNPNWGDKSARRVQDATSKGARTPRRQKRTTQNILEAFKQVAKQDKLRNTIKSILKNEDLPASQKAERISSLKLTTVDKIVEQLKDTEKKQDNLRELVQQCVTEQVNNLMVDVVKELGAPKQEKDAPVAENAENAQPADMSLQMKRIVDRAAQIQAQSQGGIIKPEEIVGQIQTATVGNENLANMVPTADQVAEYLNGEGQQRLNEYRGDLTAAHEEISQKWEEFASKPENASPDAQKVEEFAQQQGISEQHEYDALKQVLEENKVDVPASVTEKTELKPVVMLASNVKEDTATASAAPVTLAAQAVEDKDQTQAQPSVATFENVTPVAPARQPAPETQQESQPLNISKFSAFQGYYSSLVAQLLKENADVTIESLREAIVRDRKAAEQKGMRSSELSNLETFDAFDKTGLNDLIARQKAAEAKREAAPSGTYAQTVNAEVEKSLKRAETDETFRQEVEDYLKSDFMGIGSAYLKEAGIKKGKITLKDCVELYVRDKYRYMLAPGEEEKKKAQHDFAVNVEGARITSKLQEQQAKAKESKKSKVQTPQRVIEAPIYQVAVKYGEIAKNDEFERENYAKARAEYEQFCKAHHLHATEEDFNVRYYSEQKLDGENNKKVRETWKRLSDAARKQVTAQIKDDGDELDK